MHSRLNAEMTRSVDVTRNLKDTYNNNSSISSHTKGQSHNRYSSDILKTFQDELTAINSKQNIKNKEFRLRKEMMKYDQRQKSDIRNKLLNIKNQLQVRKKKEDLQKRLEKIITEHSQSVKKEKTIILPRIHHSVPTSPFAVQYRNPTEPIHPPVYYIMPTSPYKQPKYSYDNEESESEQEQFERPSPKPRKYRKLPMKKQKKDRFMSKQDRQKNKERLRKIMRKTFRAVAYIFYLKKLAKDIKEKRKLLFSKYWPQNFQKSSTSMRKWFSSNCKKFFDQMDAKKDLQINIEGDQNQTVLAHKKKMVKGLIKILIQCLNNLVDDITFQQICQIVLFFCKHGAFAQNGVLTPEQAQTVCFSEIHGYLRMNRNMQKSQIINFLFVKIILYNMLLQPWKYSQKFEIAKNQQAYENFYFLSSVFYQIVCDIQNQLLKQPREDHYKTGNYHVFKAKFKIKFCPSLIHLQNMHEEGQMISGLVPEKALDQIFSNKFWAGQTEQIIGIIDKMHQKLQKTHWKMINTVYNYKDMSKF